MSVLAPGHFDSGLLVTYALMPAVRSLVLGGLVWALLRVFRVRDVTFRLAAWTAVLYAALAMPLLGRALPRLPVLLPFGGTARIVASLPPAPPSVPEGPAATTQAVTAGTLGGAAIEDAGRKAAAGAIVTEARPAPRAAKVSWLEVATGLYCLIAGIFLGRFLLGLVLSARLGRSSAPIEDARLDRLLAREAVSAGLRKTPRVAQSGAISVPLTLGVFRPIILFPAGWSEWSDGQVGAVLAHELSHIARYDALTQVLSSVHRAFFWFSPLCWWLDRALIELSEEASDDAALRAGADRAGYAEVLLNFFRALGAARGRVRWQSVSMAQGARSTRRLERILSGAKLSHRLGQSALIAVALAAVPLACLAATVRPSLTTESLICQAPAPPAPPLFAQFPALPEFPDPIAPLPAPPAPPRPTPQKAQSEQEAGNRPEQAIESGQTEWQVREWASPDETAWVYAQQSDSSGPRQMSIYSRYDDANCAGGQEPVAVVTGNRIAAVCASGADLEKVQELRGKIAGDFLWFAKGGHAYLVRDPATVGAALKLVGPSFVVGPQAYEMVVMPDVSADMRALRAAMEQLTAANAQSEQMEQIQASLPDQAATKAAMAHLQADLADAMKALSSGSTQEDLARVQDQLESAFATLQAMQAGQARAILMAQAQLQRQAEAMAELHSQLAPLEALKLQMKATAATGQAHARIFAFEQSERARQATEQLHQLIEQAIAHGLAKRQ